jgi:predicted Zn-dependent peptidase
MNSFSLGSLIALLGVSMVTTDAVSQSTLDRTKRPAEQPLPKIELPAIQKATLSNGLAVWLVEQHKLPMLSLNLVIQAGSDHDPLIKPGIATMTAEVMDAGTAKMDALQIADKLDYIGASMSIRAGVDGTFASLETLTKHLDEALAVFGDVISHPTFPDKEFERLRSQRLTGLLQQKDRASTIASLAFNHIIYGQNHPYGNDPSGNEQSVKGLTRQDLVTFYNTYYRPNNATLIVVGDAKLTDLVKALEKNLSDWKKADVPSLSIPAAKPIDVRRVYLIDKPGAPQSEIRIGYPALARSTPDFFPVTVMNMILGGQFSSRINMNLRERRGLTYGARSGFTFSKQPGPFAASGGFVSTGTDTAVHEFLYEFDRMHAEGMTPEELAFSKKGLTGGFALNFETAGQVARALQNIVLYGLPEDYYQNYLQNIDKVSLDDVKRVAKSYLDTSKMAVVIVGDVKTIRQGVEGLHIGPTVMSDADGNPITQ